MDIVQQLQYSYGHCTATAVQLWTLYSNYSAAMDVLQQLQYSYGRFTATTVQLWTLYSNYSTAMDIVQQLQYSYGHCQSLLYSNKIPRNINFLNGLE
jgi:starvation-inducible outer membrane lipoprotein